MLLRESFRHRFLSPAPPKIHHHFRFSAMCRTILWSVCWPLNIRRPLPWFWHPSHRLRRHGSCRDLIQEYKPMHSVGSVDWATFPKRLSQRLPNTFDIGLHRKQATVAVRPDSEHSTPSLPPCQRRFPVPPPQHRVASVTPQAVHTPQDSSQPPNAAASFSIGRCSGNRLGAQDAVAEHTLPESNAAADRDDGINDANRQGTSQSSGSRSETNGGRFLHRQCGSATRN